MATQEVDPHRYDDLFDTTGQKYDVDPRLLKLVYGLESGYGANTRDSPAGAQGGMQLMPALQKHYGVTDPHNMTQAVPAAAQYLREGLDKHGSVEGALAYYHGGPDTRQWGPKTMRYVAEGQGFWPITEIHKSGKPAAAAPAPAATDSDVQAGRSVIDTILNPKPATATTTTPTTATPTTEPSDVQVGRSVVDTIINTKPPAPPTDALADVITSPDANAADIPQSQKSGAPFTYENVNKLLQPTPGWVSSGMFPIATKEVSPGEGSASAGIKFAVPGMVRDFVKGVANLLEAPSTGTISPEGSAALTGLIGTPLLNSVARGAGKAIATSALNREAAPLSDTFRAAPMTPEAKETANKLLKPPEAAPKPAESTVGASAAPKTDPYEGMTPDQAKAARASAEEKDVSQYQPARSDGTGKDTASYGEGTRPLYAAIDPKGASIPGENVDSNAIAHKVLYGTDPEYRAHVDHVVQENNAKHVDNFREVAGDAKAIHAAETARDEALLPQKQKALAEGTDVDAQPIIDRIDAMLKGNKVDQVTDALNKVRKSLFDEDGKLETSPAVLDSARDNIRNMLHKTNLAKEPGPSFARKQLVEIKQQIEQTIETGAKGYADYLKKYEEASKPIDTMEVLQDYGRKLMDVNGKLRLGSVQTMLSDLQKARAGSGVHPAKSIPDDVWTQLVHMRNDLARDRQLTELGRVPGSDTTQLLTAKARVNPGPAETRPGRAALETAGHVALAHTPMAGTGNALLGANQIYGAFKRAREAKLLAAEDARRAQSLKDLKEKLMSVHPDYEGTPDF